MTAYPSPTRDHTGRKVLLVGNVFGRELGNDYYMVMPKLLHGFIRLGCNLLVFNDREVARGSTPFLSSGPGRRAANRKLIETARNFRPDLLLLGHCEPIENATLEILRQENPGLRIAFRNVDTLTDSANRERLLRRADSVDAIFVTAAAPIHGVPPGHRAKVYFMPNPVDPAIDIGRSFERSDQDYDLFFAVGTSDGSDERLQFLLQALQRLPALKADVRGLPGRAPRRGAAFLEGLFITARSIVLGRDPRLLRIVTRALARLDWPVFKLLLPDLRRAFTRFIPAEIDAIAAPQLEECARWHRSDSAPSPSSHVAMVTSLLSNSFS